MGEARSANSRKNIHIDHLQGDPDSHQSFNDHTVGAHASTFTRGIPLLARSTCKVERQWHGLLNSNF